MTTLCTADAATRMMLRYPFWCELYYSMEVIEDNTGKIPTLATDGRNMWVNPGFWGALTIDLKVSALAHELCHKMLLHPSRRGSRDPLIWNIAADAVINNMIKKDGMPIGDKWINMPQYDGWSAEAVYNDLMDKIQEHKSKGGVGSPLPDLGDWKDIVDIEGTPEEIERFEAGVQETVRKAIERAKLQGKVPGSLEDVIERTFAPVSEKWYNRLHRFMQSLTLSEYNWKRVHRRNLMVHKIFSPAMFSERLGPVAIAIDASGSVYDKASQSGFAEHVNSILADCRPERVDILYFDTRVTRHVTVEPGELEFTSRPRGGGGTDFDDIFDYIEREGIEPAVCIVLTDLYGGLTRAEPEYPVLWATIEPDGPRPAWGEVFNVE